MPQSKNTEQNFIKIKWQAEQAAVGHLKVLRALPSDDVQSVGPFVFLDNYGPFQATAEKRSAHPHAGIEVISYLLQGANEHFDSYGNNGKITSGGAQWMAAGKGIIHAEQHLPEIESIVQGVQIWTRMPIALQDSEPKYKAIQPQEIVEWKELDTTFRLLAGHYKEHKGPIPIIIPCILLHIAIPAKKKVYINLIENLKNINLFELGMYGIAGNVLLGDNHIKNGEFGLLQEQIESISLENTSNETAHLLLMGGEPAPKPLIFGGPFVYENIENVNLAQRRFLSGKMGTLDGIPF